MVRDTSPSSRLLDVAVHATLFALMVVTLYPVLHVAAVSLSSGSAILAQRVTVFPIGINLNAYRLIFSTPKIPRGYANTLLYATVGTAVNLVLTIATAYPLSRRRLALRRFYMTLVTVTMFFGGGLIPSFLLVKALGMYNTIWALVLPGAISTWNLILMRTFFQGIPQELEESAHLDGANDVRILVSLVLPLSTAVIATIGLFYLVGHWNSWFSAVIYLKNYARYPLQVYLREIVIEGILSEELKVGSFAAQMAENRNLDDYVTVEMIKYSTLFASLVPMLVIYPFLQRYFVHGVMLGSLKG